MDERRARQADDIAGVVSPRGGAHFEIDTDRGVLRAYGVVPGERVRVVPREGDPGHADVRAIEYPSPDRVAARCALARTCGGCHWLHIAETAQTRLRLAELEQALRARGVDVDDHVLREHVAPSPLGYRCRARFQTQRRRDGLVIGFHRAGSWSTIDVPVCPLLAPGLASAYAAVRAVLPGLDARDVTGLEIAALPESEGALVFLNPRDTPPPAWPALGEALLHLTPGLIAGVAVRGAAGGGVSEIVGARTARGVTPAGKPVAAAIRGFVQSHLEGADHLADTVARLASAASGPRVLELFAGAGLLGWRMADAGAEVVAAEIDALSVEAGTRLPAPRAGSLRWLPPIDARLAWRATDRCDVVVADAPRAGLGALAGALAERGPACLVLVSCSVVGFARDVAILTRGGYRMDALVTLDLFPQTRHLETAARLVR